MYFFSTACHLLSSSTACHVYFPPTACHLLSSSTACPLLSFRHGLSPVPAVNVTPLLPSFLLRQGALQPVTLFHSYKVPQLTMSRQCATADWLLPCNVSYTQLLSSFGATAYHSGPAVSPLPPVRWHCCSAARGPGLTHRAGGRAGPTADPAAGAGWLQGWTVYLRLCGYVCVCVRACVCVVCI